jgi:hypothetical protein
MHCFHRITFHKSLPQVLVLQLQGRQLLGRELMLLLVLGCVLLWLLQGLEQSLFHWQGRQLLGRELLLLLLLGC